MIPLRMNGCYNGGHTVPVAVPLFKELITSTPRESGQSYLVAAMEFVGFDVIETIDHVVSFSVALVSTVELLHSKTGILHCDLKPINVRWSK